MLARLLCTEQTAKELAIRLCAMADHLAAAIHARPCQRLSGTFKAVEPMGLASNCDLNCLGIMIPASFTCIHGFNWFR